MKFIILIVVILMPNLSVALTLDELQQSFLAKKLRVTEAQGSELEALRKNYTVALGQVQKKYQKAGRLDEALRLKEEADLVKLRKWPMPPLAAGAPGDLVAKRKLFTRNSIAIQKKAGKTLLQIADKMNELLEEKIISRTKSGDLVAAQKVRSLQKEIINDPVFSEARALAQRIGRDGSSPVALRIRRAGDDLEVEVRYDSSGKISLMSPVENVIEITGEKKEKGSTVAKTLGEFIGGEDFKVDPYIALSEKFEDPDLGSIRFTGLTPTFNQAEAGEIGLRLQISANPKNIHVSLGDCLPKLSEKGTYRIEIRYFIPKSNKFITGLKFVQAEAGLIPGSLTPKNGEWKTFSFETESRSERPRLLMYLNSQKQVPELQRVGDYVLISELRVIHQSMSAYLVTEFDREGGQASSNQEIKKQVLFALNGNLTDQ